MKCITSLLVCPVTESGVTALKVQFPEGRWVNIWDGKWTTIEYSGESESYVNVALGKKVSTTGLSEKQEAEAQNITDGDYTTGLTITEGRKNSVVVDLKKAHKLNKVLT